jgi:oxygen-independent coproporphyrinogen-3 oxidase
MAAGICTIAGGTGMPEIDRRLKLIDRYLQRIDFYKELDLFQDIEILLQNGRLLTKEQVKEVWRRQHPDDGLSCLYVHIPFCVSRCNYCCYDSKVPRSKNEIEEYVDTLIGRIRHFSMQDRVYDTLYVGGGTPNILTAEQIKRTFGLLFSHYTSRQGAEKKIELNPWFNTRKKLDTLKGLGFNKVSFGVQSLDPVTLRSANRGYQDKGRVLGSLIHAKRLGFEEVNADLMFGLESDDDDRFMESFTEVAKLGPDTINVYKLQPTMEYAQKFLKEKRADAFSRVYKDVDSLIRRMGETAARYGFKAKSLAIDSGNMAWGFRRGTEHDSDASYTFFHPKPISCLGLGLYSQSHIYAKLVYKETMEGFIAYPIGIRREMVNHLIGQINSAGSIDKQGFSNLFGKDIRSEFPIDELILRGVLKERDGRLIYTPESRKERMRWFMLFLEESYLNLLLKEKGIGP